MAITNEQATSIGQHLLQQLEESGFGDIVEQINELLLRDPDSEQLINRPVALLSFYLTETVRILRSVSNNHYAIILQKLNASLAKGGDQVTSVVVQSIGPADEQPIDLRSAPDYTSLIYALAYIQDQIYNELQGP